MRTETREPAPPGKFGRLSASAQESARAHSTPCGPQEPKRPLVRIHLALLRLVAALGLLAAATALGAWLTGLSSPYASIACCVELIAAALLIVALLPIGRRP
jgi:hypothetical protein